LWLLLVVVLLMLLLLSLVVRGIKLGNPPSSPLL
jgi:hypothetical protein